MCQYKTIGPFIMLLFYILLSLFAAFVGNVCRLIISLTIKEN